MDKVTKTIYRAAWAFMMLSIAIAAVHFLGLMNHNHHDGAPRADCPINLRQIGLGLHMYSGDHQSKFPDTFIALKPYLKQWELFACPKHKSVIDYPLAWNELKRYGSYYYISGLTEEDPQDMVHMFELPSNHDGEGANILHTGGYVQWHSVQGPPTEAFWAVLAKNGITKEVIANSQSRIIHVDDLASLDTGVEK